ncbi:unnamed protein product [Phaeothamnion confervicola]
MLQWQGQNVFTASADGVLRLWASSADGKEWKTVENVPFHPRMSVSALVEADGTVFCGYEAPFPLALSPGEAAAAASAAAAAGSAAGNGGAAAAAGAPPPVTVGMIRTIRGSDGVQSEAIVDLATTPYAHTRKVTALALGTNDAGSLLFSGGEEGFVRVWQQRDGKLVAAGELPGHVRGVTAMVATQGLLWTASRDTTIRVWNMSTAGCIGVIGAASGGGHRGEVTCLAYMPDPDKAAAAAAAGGGAAAAAGLTGGHVLSASLDHTIRVWNAGDGTSAYEFDAKEAVTALACVPVSSAGPLILYGLQNGSVAIRDYPGFGLAFELLHAFYHVGHSRPVRAILPLAMPTTAAGGPLYFASADDSGKMCMWELALPPGFSQS